jgi:UDP-N-acetyl-2-amino-2-deoxyglucuronate dehydrogenase
MSSTAPLRVGIIGCGSIARAHAAALRFLSDDGVATVMAAADPDAAGIDRVAEIVGDVPHRYGAGADLIADPEVDAVSVVTPTRFHRDLILATAAAGKPLFAEKPLAPSFAVVHELATAIQTAAIPTQVGFQSRFHPIIRQIRSWITDAAFGAPMAYVLRDDQFWPTGAVVDGHTSWRSDRSVAGGGALLEHSIHSCDLACWLFGPVERVSAVTRRVFGFDVEDVAVATIEHTSGVVGSITSVFNGVNDREERRLEVFFEQAAVEATTDFVVGAPEDSLLVKQDRAPVAHVDVTALRRATFAADGLDPDRQYFVYQYLAYRAFAAALRAGTAPSPTIEDAVHAHEVVEAGYRSAARGAPVSIDSLGDA